MLYHQQLGFKYVIVWGLHDLWRNPLGAHIERRRPFSLFRRVHVPIQDICDMALEVRIQRALEVEGRRATHCLLHGPSGLHGASRLNCAVGVGNRSPLAVSVILHFGSLPSCAVLQQKLKYGATPQHMARDSLSTKTKMCREHSGYIEKMYSKNNRTKKPCLGTAPNLQTLTQFANDKFLPV